MPSHPTESSRFPQAIPGYRLKHRLGEGGFGEVWAAEAPGGLNKAVKIIYGYHDDVRAQNELAALEKIKQLRHPFLISLERIEVIDGRLIIVSELADHCMRTRFNHCRDNDLPGIPRDELIANLFDVAEALDYLSQENSLQHLDIKPENLLYVGSHLKVADFGLVKHVRDQHQSMAEGLTPAYSAPELFDGRPSRNSDQYSLAIVYQEMLTGGRPFSGETMTQLANQHIGSLPNLMALAPTDQPVIARALAKDCQQRYPNCRTLIEDLARRQPRTRPSASTTGTDSSDSAPTHPLDESTRVAFNADHFSGIYHTPVEIQKLPRLEIDGPPQLRPTLFVGLGRTGGRILASIKRQLHENSGSSANCPAIKFLYLDTDRRDLLEATRETGSCWLNHRETLEIPLQPREHYRDSKKDFSWLSRRWLFNVPRSQQTEGLRPLGRLALVDNIDTVVFKLSSLLEECVTAENLAATAECLKLNPDATDPRVVVVGSSAGGICSGAFIDLIYAIRTTLDERALDDSQVIGCLAHGTSGQSNAAQLGLANTYSLLSEYNHHCLRGLQPDNCSQLPTFDPGPVLTHLYFQNLGEGLSGDEYRTAIERIGQYLYLSTVSPCNHFFETCRQHASNSTHELKSFGICSASEGLGGLSANSAQELAENLIDFWKHDCTNGQEEELTRLAESLVGKYRLDPRSISDEWSNVVSKLWQSNRQAKARSLACECVQHARSAALSADKLMRNFAKRLTTTIGNPNSAEKGSLHAILKSVVTNKLQSMSSEMDGEVRKLVDSAGSRIAGARFVLDHVLDYLKNASNQIRSELAELQQKRRLAQQHAAENLTSLWKKHKSRASNSEVVDSLEAIANLHIQIAERDATRLLYEHLGNQLETRGKDLREIAEQLVLVNEAFRNACGSSLLDSGDANSRGYDLVGDAIQQHVRSRFPQLIAIADCGIALKHHNSLFDWLTDQTDWLRYLPALIRQCCQELIASSLENLSLDELFDASEFGDEGLATWVKETAQQASPHLDGSGGAIRLMLGVPNTAGAANISELFEQQTGFEPTVVAGASGDCICCFEVDQISLDNLALAMIESCRDATQLISRLHTRSDVNWLALTLLA